MSSLQASNFFPIRAVSFSVCPLRAPFLAHVLYLGACQRPHIIFSPHATRGCFPLAAWFPSFGDRATFSRRHFLACLPFFCTVFVPTCPQALIRTGTRLHLKLCQGIDKALYIYRSQQRQLFEELATIMELKLAHPHKIY